MMYTAEPQYSFKKAMFGKNVPIIYVLVKINIINDNAFISKDMIGFKVV